MSNELDLIKTDKYLNDFINRNNLSNEFVQRNIGKFLRVYHSRKKCEGCPGLYACSQDGIGNRLDFSFDEVLIDEVEYCDYALNKLKKNSIVKSYVYCDIPDKTIDIDLNSIKYEDSQKDLYLQLSKILNKKAQKGLYIVGDLGVGKTYLCVALANSLVKNGEKVAFVKVSNFFNEMKSYLGNKDDMLDVTLNKLKKADYLFLDDIGSESVSDFVRDDILLPILDYRLENNLMTIFTSNLNKTDLLNHYTYDRKDNSNKMKAKRLLERIDILTKDFTLLGDNLRR